MIFEVTELVDSTGHSRFAEWFDALDDVTAARIHSYVTRLSVGNFANSKPLKDGVFEVRIDFGPGYRVYYGRNGMRLILLLSGGDKRSQRKDIECAKAIWADYLKTKGT